MTAAAVALRAGPVDLVRNRIDRDTGPVELTSREADLLRYLADHPSRVVTRDELLREVWGYADSVVSRACDNTVRRLREKVEVDPARPDHLLTVHGEGYRFEPGGAGGSEVAPVEPLVWVELGPVRVAPRARRVSAPDGERTLTEIEARLLEALLDAGGGVVDKGALARAVWGRFRAPLGGAIHALRAKLAPADVIVTARGGGYRLAVSEVLADMPGTWFGREEELQLARELLQTTDWLLLLGPAGVGKTSLARRLAPSATWVDLAGCDTADEVVDRVVRGLGVETRSRDPVAAVADVLARRGGVLVLDNLEQVGAAITPLIEAWQSPGPRLVGTSRVRPGAAREAIVELGPLDPRAAADLFEARIRAVSPRLRSEPLDRALVDRIVDRVDRMPLAIELLAPRVAVLGLAELAERTNVDLLVRPATADPRHHSVSALVQAAIGGLPGPARDALGILGQYRSGFFVDDAEALLGHDAVDLLQILRDHSLLFRLPNVAGLARFDTWQAVHDHLDGQAMDQDLVRRWCGWMARFDTQPSPLRTAGSGQVVARMVAQVDDLARAASGALALGDPELATRCGHPAAVVLHFTGSVATGHALLERLLAAGPPGRACARLLSERGNLALTLGRAEAAMADWSAAGDLAREHGPADLEGRCRWRTARYAAVLALPGAEDGTRAARATFERESGLEGYVALCDIHLAMLRGDSAAVRASGSRALRHGRQHGDLYLVAQAAQLVAADGQTDGRRTEGVEALRGLLRDEVFPGLRWDLLQMLAAVAASFDDAAGLREVLPELVSLAERVGTPGDFVVHQARGSLAILEGRWDDAREALDRALSLLGADRSSAWKEIALLGVRIDLARKSGQPHEALELARDQRAMAGAQGFGGSAAYLEEGLARLALGELGTSRSLFDARPPIDRGNRVLELAWEAVLCACEGADAGERLAALKAEVQRSGRPYPDHDLGRVGAALGAWAADRLAEVLDR